jgi:hypothetical protein
MILLAEEKTSPVLSMDGTMTPERGHDIERTHTAERMK